MDGLAGMLPDFTPRDPHNLWFPVTASAVAPQHQSNSVPTQGHDSSSHRQRNQILERTLLARLVADEHYFQRRRENIQNFGSGWLRPAGVPKTLHQMREERREAEEHAEAIRREQLAQELEQAEQEGLPELGPGDGAMDDVQLDGDRDLDEDIPDADLDLDIPYGDEDANEAYDSEDDGGRDEGNEGDTEASDGGNFLQQERANEILTARMRMREDTVRAAVARGDQVGEELYGDEAGLTEEEEGHLLEEDDVLREEDVNNNDDNLGMDADLDEEVPEAENQVYEHTDSEATLNTDETGGQEQDDDDDDDDDDDNDDDENANDVDVGFAPRAAPLGPPQSPTLQGRMSLSGGRMSMDLSNLLSQDESSFMDESPVPGRRNR